MRVLVLRPDAAAGRTAAALVRRGHEPVTASVLEIEMTGAAPPSGPFAALVVTSANALPALTDRRGDLGDLPVFAVGHRTARALAGAGWRVAGTAADAAGLARLMGAELPPGPLLHAAGCDRRDEPAATLRRGGFAIEAWEVYRARAVDLLPPEAAARLAAGTLDAALHYSRRSAESALALMRSAGLEPAFGGLLHICLSHETARGLGALAGARIRVAAEPDEARLLDLVDGMPADHRARPGVDPDAKDGTNAPA